MPRFDFEAFFKNAAFLKFQKTIYILIGPLKDAASQDFEMKVFSPQFFLDQTNQLQTSAQSFELPIESFEISLNEFLGETKEDLKFDWQEPKFEDYQICFNAIKQKMQKKELDKAVPVLFARAKKNISTLEKAHILRNLLRAPQLYQYGYWNESEGMIGATPEVLINIQKGELSSMALAGTEIKTSGLASTLMENPKERHEHDLVVQDVLEQLKKFGSISVTGPTVAELPTLWHLKTEMKMPLTENFDPIEIMRRMHPTPALGVFPRAFGYEWLKGLPEANLRKKYGAPFAMILPNRDFICLVAIRNIQWMGDEVILGSGGGVVRDSRIENEWQELQDKRNSVRKLMGLST